MKRFALAVAFACLLLTGCGNQGPIADELTDFNKAQQQGTAQLILLNVLRAREQQPLAYSHFDVLRGGITASSGLGLGIPFGPGSSGKIKARLSGGPACG
jgi:predicted small lipoprotein YifL